MILNNKELQLELAIEKLQYAYNEYVEVIVKSIRCTFFDINGDYVTPPEYKKYSRKMIELEDIVRKYKETVDALREQIYHPTDPKKLN